jgi:malate dehydrogenase (quinone)
MGLILIYPCRYNLWPLITAGYKNFQITKYLVKQVSQSDEDRFAALQKYYPEAKREDWELIVAGQRVQIIKREGGGEGVLQFGTEIVSSNDDSLAALLGASPGASNSVSIMLDLLDDYFGEQMKTEQWKQVIREMIPSFGCSLIKYGAIYLATR